MPYNLAVALKSMDKIPMFVHLIEIYVEVFGNFLYSEIKLGTFFTLAL